MTDEGDGVRDCIVPAWSLPGRLPHLTTGLHVSKSPEMVDVIKGTDLGKEPGSSAIVSVTVMNPSGPMVAPLQNCAWFECVASELVNVVGLSGGWVGPEGELEAELGVTRAKKLTALLAELLQVLILSVEFVLVLDTVPSIRKGPKVNHLILVPNFHQEATDEFEAWMSFGHQRRKFFVKVKVGQKKLRLYVVGLYLKYGLVLGEQLGM